MRDATILKITLQEAYLGNSLKNLKKQVFINVYDFKFLMTIFVKKNKGGIRARIQVIHSDPANFCSDPRADLQHSISFTLSLPSVDAVSLQVCTRGSFSFSLC